MLKLEQTNNMKAVQVQLDTHYKEEKVLQSRKALGHLVGATRPTASTGHAVLILA